MLLATFAALSLTGSGATAEAAPAPTESPILIRSVGLGTAANGAAEHVTLQMTVDGQDDLDGAELRFYGPGGEETDVFGLFGGGLVGEAQRTILLARPAALAESGFPDPDFVLAAGDALQPAGGAVCLTGPYPPDCATWGSFPQSAALALPDPQALNAEPVRAGASGRYELGRSIGGGCPSWLDPEDDNRPSPAHFHDGVLAEVPMPPPEPDPLAPRSNAQGRPPGTAPCLLQTGFDITPPNPTNDVTPFFDYGSVPREYGSEFRCRLAPHPIGPPAGTPFAPCEASGATYGPLADGDYDFEVYAIGADGPDPTPLQWTFRVDTAPPQTTIVSTPGAVSHGFSASFSFASSEEHPTFICSLDNGPRQPCEPGKTFYFLADGNHIFRVWASDQATNQDPSPAEHTFFVDGAFGDTSPPFTAIVSGPPRQTKQPSARFAYTSSEPGNRFQCRVDQQPFAACEAGGQSYPGLPNGRHVFEVRAIDRAGNVDPTPEPYAWTIDGPVPETRLTRMPPGVMRVAKRGAKRAVTFGFESSRPRSTFACRLDGGPFRACSSPLRVRARVGRHRFEAYAIDALGNADPTPVRRNFKILVRGASKGFFSGGKKRRGKR